VGSVEIVHPEHAERVARTLALFNPLHHAPVVGALTLQTYQLTHEGGTDHDHLDAWLASRFGTESMSRFLRVPA
jgi:hypothetical protein